MSVVRVLALCCTLEFNTAFTGINWNTYAMPKRKVEDMILELKNSDYSFIDK